MSESASHNSSLDTNSSPSIDMEQIPTSTTTTTKSENNNTNINIDGFDNILLPNTNNIHNNTISDFDFLMDGLHHSTSQITNGSNINMSSPLLEFQPNPLLLTPSLGAIQNIQFDLSGPGGAGGGSGSGAGAGTSTPHLPELNMDNNTLNNNSANSHQLSLSSTNNNNNNNNIDDIIHNISDIDPSMSYHSYLPQMSAFGINSIDNIPPPTSDIDWNTFYSLITPINHNNNTIPPNIDDNIDNIQQDTNHITISDVDKNKSRKRKKIDPIQHVQDIPTKKRKLNNNNNNNNNNKTPKKKKKGRGRPRKNPIITIKKEKKDNKNKNKNKKNKKNKNKKMKNNNSPNIVDENGNIDMEQYLSSQYGAESFVGIRTDDGEVRIQIPGRPKNNNNNNNNNDYHSKIKYTVFGNACSDKIEDILQPKKRTRYVRGLSEEEKKTRRREQNRNAAARSRARKNAMISKVIQLHQENMGLRVFVAENITQTKLLREEIGRLHSLVQQQQSQLLQSQSQSQQPHTQTQQSQTQIRTQSLSPQPTSQPTLFDIINQDKI